MSNRRTVSAPPACAYASAGCARSVASAGTSSPSSSAAVSARARTRGSEAQSEVIAVESRCGETAVKVDEGSMQCGHAPPELLRDNDRQTGV